MSKALRGRGRRLETAIARNTTSARINLSLMCCNFVAALLCMHVQQFWPHLVEQNHPQISSTAVGVLIALQPFALILTTPICGSLMIRIGRRRALYVGFWVATAATFMQFASAIYITNDQAFYAIAFCVRFVEGIAEALAINAIYSICCLEFPDKPHWYMGYLNLAMGVGMMLGPALTNLMIEKLDYTNTLIAVGTVLLFASTFAVSALPERIDLRRSNWGGGFGFERKNISIPYRSFFKNVRVVMALVSVAICATCQFYLNSDINMRIMKDDDSSLNISTM